MGLDLYLFKRSDWDKRENEDDVDLNEVWYGRKTWDVYDFLGHHSANKVLENEVFEVSFESVKDLYNKLAPYIGYINMFSMIDESIATEVDDDVAERIYGLIGLSDEDPQLGYIWEMYAYKRLLDVMNEIMEIYQNGDSLVMVASY